MNVRSLGDQDAADFKRVFLHGLTEHPEAFAMSIDEMEVVTEESLAQSFASPDIRFYGSFAEERLIGIVNLQRYGRAKLRHRASIGSMYVLPEARGQGVGKSLLDQALKDARLWQGLEDVILAVTVGNEAARKLYLSAGFQAYSLDPRLLMVNGCYFDVEWMIHSLNR